MRGYSLLLICILIMGCGSKKKIVSYNKGYDVSKEVKNSSSDERSTHNDVTVSEKKEKSSEGFIQREITNVIFDKDGRPVSYTHTKETSGTKGSESSETSSNNKSSETNKSSSTQETKDTEKETVSKERDVQKKNPSPLIYWIGAGVCVLIVIWGWKKFGPKLW